MEFLGFEKIKSCAKFFGVVITKLFSLEEFFGVVKTKLFVCGFLEFKSLCYLGGEITIKTGEIKNNRKKLKF